MAETQEEKLAALQRVIDGERDSARKLACQAALIRFFARSLPDQEHPVAKEGLRMADKFDRMARIMDDSDRERVTELESALSRLCKSMHPHYREHPCMYAAKAAALRALGDTAQADEMDRITTEYEREKARGNG